MTLHPTTLTELVERLQRLRPTEIDLDTVTAILGHRPLDEDSLRPFVGFRDDQYARNQVHRSDLFDVVVLCWRPGQHTPVHNHNGQRGWVRLVRGALEETTWRHAGGGTCPDLASLEIDDEGVGHGIDLERTGHRIVTEIGEVATVDAERAIHQLGNATPEGSGEDMITLHVYSRPHDSCLVFDPEARTCCRRELAFDSVPEVPLVPTGG